MASIYQRSPSIGKWMLLVFNLLIHMSTVTFSYNLEQSVPIIKKQSNLDGSRSLFGYALTLHQQDASTFWLVCLLFIFITVWIGISR